MENWLNDHYYYNKDLPGVIPHCLPLGFHSLLTPCSEQQLQATYAEPNCLPDHRQLLPQSYEMDVYDFGQPCNLFGAPAACRVGRVMVAVTRGLG